MPREGLFACQADAGSAEAPRPSILLDCLLKHRLEHCCVKIGFRQRRTRLRMALEEIEPWLHRLHIQAGQIRNRLPERAQTLGGIETMSQGGGVDRESTPPHLVFELSQRERMALLGFQTRLQCDDSSSLVPECHLAAQFVFDEMRGEHVAFRAPRPEQDDELAEALLPCLRPQLLNRKQAGVAAGFDDEVLVAGPSRHGQWISDAARTYRFLDLGKLRIAGPSRVVLVGTYVVDRELDLAVMARVCLCRQLSGVVSRIADPQRLGDEAPAFVDGHLAAGQRCGAAVDICFTLRPSAHAIFSCARMESA